MSGYDLHLHSYWSYDGLVAPESYFRAAQERGLSCIAITDHHVVDGFAEIRECEARYPDVRSVPGAELSVTTEHGGIIDLLVYGLTAPAVAQLQPVWDAYHEWQRAQGATICAAMQAAGMPFSDDDRIALLASYRPPKTIAVQGHTHVKAHVFRDYLFERGWIAARDQYRPFLAGLAAFKPFPPYPHARTVVPAVKQHGALVAIAHPYRYFKGADRKRMDAIREELSLDGIECARPELDLEYTEKYRQYCEAHGLLALAGSDCHHDEHVADRLGRHTGKPEWLQEFLDRLDRPAGRWFRGRTTK